MKIKDEGSRSLKTRKKREEKKLFVLKTNDETTCRSRDCWASTSYLCLSFQLTNRRLKVALDSFTCLLVEVWRLDTSDSAPGCYGNCLLLGKPAKLC